MSDPAIPSGLMERLQSIQRRLDDLERTPQLQNTSFEGGTLRFRDSTNGDPILEVGDIYDNDGQLLSDGPGFQVRGGPSNSTFFRVASKGLEFPYIYLNVKEAGNFKTISSVGGYADQWSAVTLWMSHDVLRANSTVTLSSTAVAKARWEVLGTIPEYTDEVTLDGSLQTQWSLDLEYLHGRAIGSGAFTINLQVKMTSGTGSVNVYEPTYIALVPSRIFSDATTGGLTAS